MNEKKVSVIIPMYNAEETIEQTLGSIGNQTKLANILEVLIIDDGSKDRSKEIVELYADKHKEVPIKYIFQQNSGVSVARNRGLREAKGEFIAFLDSDDIWFDNKIERQLEVFEEYPSIVFLGTAHKDRPLKRFGKTINSLYKARLEDVLWSYFPVTPSVMFKREALIKVGYFDEKMSHCEDINYYLRFLINYNYYFLPEKLVEIDCGKLFMREKGLTSNLKMMHKGEMKNLRDMWEQGHLCRLKYVAFYFFTELKYVRRVMITAINKVRNKE